MLNFAEKNKRGRQCYDENRKERKGKKRKGTRLERAVRKKERGERYTRSESSRVGLRADALFNGSPEAAEYVIRMQRGLFSSQLDWHV